MLWAVLLVRLKLGRISMLQWMGAMLDNLCTCNRMPKP